MPRGRFLAQLMDGRFALGVCGTHGKTTPSWLLAQCLIAAGLDPSVYIGGVVKTLPFGNHRTGSGPFVSELDESDGTFLLPRLAVAVINNIESDHLSHYGTDERLIDAFREYAKGVEEGGALIAGLDNAEAKRIFEKHEGRKFGFAVDVPADYRATDIAFGAEGSEFSLAGEKSVWGRFSIPMPGRHNSLNALAALAAAVAAGVPPEAAKAALAGASGVERRMEKLGERRGATWYSDYAHHPSEVAAAIAGLRQRHAGGVMVVFQPHLYSRTRDYAEAFAAALAAADRVLIGDIYPAREEPVPGVTANSIAAPLRALHADTHGPVSLAEVADAATRLAAGMEAVVMTGAGDIDDAAREMMHDLA
jgi:UDP-N-acetylmuramate--alanine ligase